MTRGVEAGRVSAATARYLAMQREAYADLAIQSTYGDGTLVPSDGEFVVGSYAAHEQFDYERWLLTGVRLGEGSVALEYGCGPGRMLLRLAHWFHRVDGVDISREVLDIAARRTAHLPVPPWLYQTDGQSLPATLVASHDVALSVICLQHICVRRVRLAILTDLYRALKPGGLLTFQMGYGPGHQSAVNYDADFTEATGTNGRMDVRVLHPSDVCADLRQIGFTNITYALVPTGPGDTHGAWIFVRAWTPGAGALVERDDRWPGAGFVPWEDDPGAVRLARERHVHHGLIAVAERLEADAERWRAVAAALERDLESHRAAEAVAAETLASTAARHADERQHHREQLARLRTADAARLAALVDRTLARARAKALRVAVFGAGEHTTWLAQITPLRNGPLAAVYDSAPTRQGHQILGCIVQPIAHIVDNPPDVLIVSSLAFQEEMAAHVTSFGLPHVEIVRCYPPADASQA